MARTTPPKGAEELFAELESASDRAAILVGATLVEYALEQAIESRLRQVDDPKEQSMLFAEREGILGTFSEKIWAAYFLKIIGPIVRQDLDMVRRIRNFAAHNPNSIDFEKTSEIASRCRELKTAKEATLGGETPASMKNRYLLTVQFFTANLLMRAGDQNAVIAEAFSGLAPWLDR